MDIELIAVDGQHGYVALTNYMVEEPTLTVVNMARGSLGKRVTEVAEKDYALIDRLEEENHTSPFRHSYITLFIQCPLFVKNQIIKHQVGGAWSFVDSPWNEISGRYVTYDKFWIPDALHKKGRISKSGGTDEIHDQSDTLIGEYMATQQAAYKTYMKMIEAGVAREEARTVLGLYTYTSMYVTGSMQYWAHLVKLRTAVDAQRQTREYAFVIEAICKAVYGYAWVAFMDEDTQSE